MNVGVAFLFLNSTFWCLTSFQYFPDRHFVENLWCHLKIKMHVNVNEHFMLTSQLYIKINPKFADNLSWKLRLVSSFSSKTKNFKTVILSRDRLTPPSSDNSAPEKIGKLQLPQAIMEMFRFPPCECVTKVSLAAAIEPEFDFPKECSLKWKSCDLKANHWQCCATARKTALIFLQILFASWACSDTED